MKNEARFREALEWVRKAAFERAHRAELGIAIGDDTEGYWTGYRDGLRAINAVAHDVLAGKALGELGYSTDPYA